MTMRLFDFPVSNPPILRVRLNVMAIHSIAAIKVENRWDVQIGIGNTGYTASFATEALANEFMDLWSQRIEESK